MSSLADTYGWSPSSDGRSGRRTDGTDTEPLLRPSSSEAAESEDEPQVGTALTLVGVGLMVVGVGIAFFSSTLPAALGYSLLVVLGTVAVARRFLGLRPASAVVFDLMAQHGQGRGRPRPGRRNRNRGSKRRQSSSVSRGLVGRRSRLAPLRDAVGRLVSPTVLPWRDRGERL